MKTINITQMITQTRGRNSEDHENDNSEIIEQMIFESSSIVIDLLIETAQSSNIHAAYIGRETQPHILTHTLCFLLDPVVSD